MSLSLNVKNMGASIAHYVEKLDFKKVGGWSTPVRPEGPCPGPKGADLERPEQVLRAAGGAENNPPRRQPSSAGTALAEGHSGYTLLMWSGAWKANPLIGGGGQILDSHDMPGICTRFHPRFIRRCAHLGREMRSAFERAPLLDVEEPQAALPHLEVRAAHVAA